MLYSKLCTSEAVWNREDMNNSLPNYYSKPRKYISKLYIYYCYNTHSIKMIFSFYKTYIYFVLVHISMALKILSKQTRFSRLIWKQWKHGPLLIQHIHNTKSCFLYKSHVSTLWIIQRNQCVMELTTLINYFNDLKM